MVDRGISEQALSGLTLEDLQPVSRMVPWAARPIEAGLVPNCPFGLSCSKSRSLVQDLKLWWWTP